jgi:hypothetical protein
MNKANELLRRALANWCGDKGYDLNSVMEDIRAYLAAKVRGEKNG